MRKSIPQESESSNAMNIYQSMLDQEYAQMISQDPQGGLGIRKIVLNQLNPQKAINQFNNVKMNKEVNHE
jgi:Rod binding domain-containing protein